MIGSCRRSLIPGLASCDAHTRSKSCAARAVPQIRTDERRFLNSWTEFEGAWQLFGVEYAASICSCGSPDVIVRKPHIDCR
jgi:hypothetical protein